VTINRLLVLVLSLSFLLLALPAVTDSHAQGQATVSLSEPKRGGQDRPVPTPRPDDTGLFLLAAAPEAPTPVGTDDTGGKDGLTLPSVSATAIPHFVNRHASVDYPDSVRHACARPWATGPPRG